VPAEQVAGLRQLFADRIAYFDAAAHRVRAAPAAEVSGEVSAAGDGLPEGWELLVEMLQVERSALVTAEAGAAGPGERAQLVDLQEEADTRVAAVQAALDRLDELARERQLPPDRVACVRTLLEARIARIRELMRNRAAQAGTTPSGWWSLAVDVLETERRELARYAAADEVSGATAERVHRDLRVETAALAG
jgi:hypothetical protein